MPHLMMSTKPVPSIALLAVCLLAAPCSAATNDSPAGSVNHPPAFPGAVGQGAASLGGRGGDVYRVTTLEDYHPKTEKKIPGSLRHALRSAEGPRTVVFDVGGPIALKAPLQVLKDRITIAGQTAPGAGVTLWGYPLSISRGSDIVIRYLRVRLGDFHAMPLGDRRPARPGNADLDASRANAVDIGGDCQRVILDHVSASWGMDETLSVTKCRDVTVQHSIIAWSLNDSFHAKGPHGYGTLVRGELTEADQAAGRGGFTLYGNLWAHHRARNPSVGGQQRLDPGQSESDRRRTDVNIVNNVVYDWGGNPTHRSEFGGVRINFIGNCYVNGPAKRSSTIFKTTEKGVTALYYSDNALDADQNSENNLRDALESAPLAKAYNGFEDEDLLISPSEGSPFPFLADLTGRLQSSAEAYQAVVSSVGCSLNRDSADATLIETLTQRRGGLIDTQEELRDETGVLPGIDDLPTARRPDGFDSDGDGMPNEFENANHLNPNDPTDGPARSLDDRGYTNLEVYLEQCASSN